MPRFRIDPHESRIWIDGKSSLHAIHATSDGLAGYVDLEFGPLGGHRVTASPVGTLSLPVSRLSSGSAMEDRELYKRVDLKRYPTIEAVLIDLIESGEEGSYRARGEITFRGVSRHYQDEMTLRGDDRTVVLSGSSRFDIRDFGIEPPRMLMLRVEPEVDVRIEIVAQQEV